MNSFFIKIIALDFRKVFIIGLVLGVGYYFMFFDDGAALQTQIDAMKIQIAAEQQRQQESDKAIKKAAALKEGQKILNDRYKELIGQMPTEVQMAEVLKVIDSMAITANVSIKGKEPRKPEIRKIFEEVPIHVTAEGSFSALTMFMYNLMNSGGVRRINNFSIQRYNGKEGNSKPLALDIVISNYRILSEKEMPEEPGIKK